MKQKREDFRQQIRKQANEKVFTQVRILLQKKSQTESEMQTSEKEFFDSLSIQLEQNLQELKALQIIMKKWEDQFNKKQMTTLLFNPKTQYFKAILRRFELTKTYIRLLIYTFISLEPDLSEVHHIVYEEQLINKLLNEFGNMELKIQQQILYLLSVLVQYSQLYRLAIKNSGIIDVVIKQLVIRKLENIPQNYIECFIFLIWSLINPEITNMSDLLEIIYESLLNLHQSLKNFQSDYLLSIIFKGAAKFTFCRELMFQSDLNILFQPLSNPMLNSQIMFDFLDFLSTLFMQEPEVFEDFFPKFCWQIIVIYMTSQSIALETKIRSVYLLIEAFNLKELAQFFQEQGILNILLSVLPQANNFDLIQGQFSLLQIYLNHYPQINEDQIKKIALSIVNAPTIIIEVQLISVWQIILYLIQDTEFSKSLIHFLRQQNFINIAEQCVQYSKSTITTHIMSRCIDYLQ